MRQERVEDVVAKRFENDFVVIRTYKKGCPDLILIPKELARKITVLEVKGPGDAPKKHQIETINCLKRDGIDAKFHYESWEALLEEKRKKRLVKEEARQKRLDEEEMWIVKGMVAFQQGRMREDYPRDTDDDDAVKKGSARWYRRRCCWQTGWDDARHEKAQRLKQRYVTTEPKDI
jgi:hypothetical protein